MKVFLICLVIAAVIVGAAFALNHFGIWPFGSGIGDGDGEGTVESPVTDQDEEQEVIVTERPPSLLIEIRENKVIYDGDEVTLDELETILQKFVDIDEIWTIQDAYRATKSTYDDVKELLVKHDLVFAER